MTLSLVSIMRELIMKNGIKKIAAASLGVVVSFGVVSIASAQIDMKIGYPTTADPQHDYATKFVAEVNKRSNGKIKGRVSYKPIR